jgi:hypothetical protein
MDKGWVPTPSADQSWKDFESEELSKGGMTMDDLVMTDMVVKLLDTSEGRRLIGDYVADISPADCKADAGMAGRVRPQMMTSWKKAIEHVLGGGKVFLQAPKAALPGIFWGRNRRIGKAPNFTGDVFDSKRLDPKFDIYAGHISSPKAVSQLKKEGFMFLDTVAPRAYLIKNAGGDKRRLNASMRMRQTMRVQKQAYDEDSSPLVSGTVAKPCPAFRKLQTASTIARSSGGVPTQDAAPSGEMEGE